MKKIEAIQISDSAVKRAKKKAKPVVQWAGGKSRLLSKINTFFPDKMNAYYEPFLGGGSLLINLLERLEANEITVLGSINVNDKNKSLIEMYCVIQSNPDKLIEHLEQLKGAYNNTETKKKEMFLSLRSEFNTLVNDNLRPVYRSALFIILNKSSFGGIYSENKAGEMNSTFHSKDHNLGFYVADNVYRLSYLFTKYQVIFYALDFREFLTQQEFSKDDFVYLDPPYYDRSYTRYIRSGFHNEDSDILFEMCQKNIPRFLMSNSNSQELKDIFSEYDISEISIHRNLRKGKNGKVLCELLIYRKK